MTKLTKRISDLGEWSLNILGLRLQNNDDRPSCAGGGTTYGQSVGLILDTSRSIVNRSVSDRRNRALTIDIFQFDFKTS